MIDEDMIKSILEDFKNIKNDEDCEKKVTDILVKGVLSGAVVLTIISDMHENEGVYECSFMYKLNTDDFDFEPLGAFKISKLRGKTND